MKLDSTIKTTIAYKMAKKKNEKIVLLLDIIK